MATDVEDMEIQKSEAPSLSLQARYSEACEKRSPSIQNTGPTFVCWKGESVSSLRNYHDNILSSFAEDPPLHTQKNLFVIDKRQRIARGLLAFPDFCVYPFRNGH